MASFRLKVLGGVVVGVLVVVAGIALLSTPRDAPPPVVDSGSAREPDAATPAAPAPDQPPVASRSRGETEWAFFFRPGDTLSRMDGTPLGVVVKLEREHRFADGSTGPAYVVRSPEGEATFDADELERRARIEAVREFRLPPARPPGAATR